MWRANFILSNGPFSGIFIWAKLTWDPVIEKFEGKSASWKRQYLSKEGNTRALIKNTLLSPLVHLSIAVGLRMGILEVGSLGLLKNASLTSGYSVFQEIDFLVFSGVLMERSCGEVLVVWEFSKYLSHVTWNGQRVRILVEWKVHWMFLWCSNLGSLQTWELKKKKKAALVDCLLVRHWGHWLARLHYGVP